MYETLKIYLLTSIILYPKEYTILLFKKLLLPMALLLTIGLQSAHSQVPQSIRLKCSTAGGEPFTLHVFKRTWGSEFEFSSPELEQDILEGRSVVVNSEQIEVRFKILQTSRIDGRTTWYEHYELIISRYDGTGTAGYDDLIFRFRCSPIEGKLF